MILAGAHKYFTEKWTGPELSQANEDLGRKSPLTSLRTAAMWDRQDNPFERKWLWKDKGNFPAGVESCIRRMENYILMPGLFRTDERPLIPDGDRWYAGAFTYFRGDHLGVHVDAGIAPTTGLRKRYTALLYFGGRSSPLELWGGNSCVGKYAEPKVDQWVETIPCDYGQFVIFENNDYAWHGVSPQYDIPPRYVLTISFMAHDEGLPYKNMRRRAFFVPRPHEIWTPETYSLRDERAGVLF